MPMNGRPDPDPGYSTPGAINNLNHRVMPPTNPARLTGVAFGRTYVGVLGVPMTIEDNDAEQLEANGWQFIALSGPTSKRPTPTATARYNATAGMKFWDEGLGALIQFDGQVWRGMDGSPA